jgi:hypothetical protein
MSILSSLREHLFLKKYRELGGEESERYLKFLLESSVSRMSFLSAYEKLEPIENMGKKEKIEMYRYVVGLFPEASNPERKIICKVLYTVGILL